MYRHRHIDIDNFRNLNDAHGHGWHRALRGSRLLRESCRHRCSVASGRTILAIAPLMSLTCMRRRPPSGRLIDPASSSAFRASPLSSASAWQTSSSLPAPPAAVGAPGPGRGQGERWHRVCQRKILPSSVAWSETPSTFFRAGHRDRHEAIRRSDDVARYGLFLAEQPGVDPDRAVRSHRRPLLHGRASIPDSTQARRPDLDGDIKQQRARRF